MNNTFSPKRFGLYVKQYSGENWKKLLQMVASVVGALILASSIIPFVKGSYSHPSLFKDPMWDVEMSIFWIIFYAVVPISAGLMFSSLGTKTKRIRTLTIPVSNMEKFFTYFLFYGFATYILFIAGAILADWIRVWTAPIYAVEGATIEHLPIKYFLTFGAVNEDMQIPADSAMRVAAVQLMLVSSVIILQSFFTLSSSIWPASGKMKGFLSAICIIIGTNFITYMSSGLWFPESARIVPRFMEYDMGFETFKTIGYVVSTLITLGLYFLAYKRFKEMETVMRW